MSLVTLRTRVVTILGTAEPRLDVSTTSVLLITSVVLYCDPSEHWTSPSASRPLAVRGVMGTPSGYWKSGEP
jgi:hypothetical protein